MHKVKHPKFLAVMGTCLIFKRDKYFQVGGHKNVKDKVVEDFSIGRLFKKKGLKVISLLDSKSISTHMYTGFRDSCKGFLKNAYDMFDTNLSKFLLIWIFFNIIWLIPFVIFFFDSRYIFVIIFMLIERFLIDVTLRRFDLTGILIYPIQSIAWSLLLLYSMYLSKSNKLMWKGRNVSK